MISDGGKWGGRAIQIPIKDDKAAKAISNGGEETSSFNSKDFQFLTRFNRKNDAKKGSRPDSCNNCYTLEKVVKLRPTNDGSPQEGVKIKDQKNTQIESAGRQKEDEFKPAYPISNLSTEHFLDYYQDMTGQDMTMVKNDG